MSDAAVCSPDGAPVCEEKFVHAEKTARAAQKLPEKNVLSDLAELYKIFGDATRIKILILLSEEELCVCDIANTLQMSVSAISHQLRVLKGAKLVKYAKSGKSVFYSLSDDHVKHILAQGIEHVCE